jgi:copper chaperone CopZ
MNIGKSSSSKKIIIIVAFVLIAVTGFVSFSYISASTKKAVSSGIEASSASNFNKPVGALTDSQDATPPGQSKIADNISKVVLRVDGMSCSGCIYTIKSSLAGFKGVRDILVNLPSGQAEIYYDNGQIEDVSRIADAITAGGYPAKVIEVLSADQIRKERSLATARSLNYIASVGAWDVSRDDFNIELEHAKNRYAQIYGDGIFTSNQGKVLIDKLKAQIVSRLINEGIQIQEIGRAGFTVATATVDAEFDKFLNQKGIELQNFKTDLEENGYAFDYFMKKFENRVLINKYLDEKILDGPTDKFEKQRRYTSWFNNAKLLAKVVYYDGELERLIQARAAGSGCSSDSSCRKEN